MGGLNVEAPQEYPGRAVVGKLNTDENGDTAAAYRVSAIPTLLFFKGGKLVEQLVGVQPKTVTKAKLDSLRRLAATLRLRETKSTLYRDAS